MTKSVPTVRQTVSNLVAIWGNRILAILAMLITTPLIVHRFGMETTGIWLMITQFVSHLSLLDAGLGNILVRFLAAQRATSNAAKGSEYLTTTFYLLAGIGVLLLAGSPFLAQMFMKSLHGSSEAVAGAHETAWIAIACIAVSLPMRVGHGLLSSTHRMDKLNMMVSLSVVVRIVLIVCVFRWFDPGLIHLGGIVFGSTLLGTVLVFVSGLKQNSLFSLHPSGFSRSAVHDLFSLGGSALVVTFAALLLTQSTSMLTGYAIGPAFVPIVAYPLMIFTALTPFMAALQTMLTPVAAALAAKQQKQEIFPIFLMAVRYQSAAAFFLLLIFSMFGHPLLVAWLSGPKMGTDALAIISRSVVILFIGFAFSSVAFIGRSVLTSVGRHWPSALIEMGTALAGLVVGYLLARFSALGVYGITFGVALVLVIRGLLFYPYLIGRFFGISPIKVINQGLGVPFRITAATVSMVVVMQLWLTRYFNSDFQIALMYIKIFSLSIWLLLMWRYLIETKHKQMLRHNCVIYWSRGVRWLGRVSLLK